MPSCSTQRTLSTYFINKQLAENLEDYLNKGVPEILNLSLTDEKTHASFEIILHDSNGQEAYSSIHEYRLAHFRNDITSMGINYSLYSHKKDLRASLRFGSDKENTDIAITLTDENPREKIAAIENGILGILNQNKTYNWLLNPIWYLNAILVLGTMYCVLKAFGEDSKSKESAVYGIIGSAGVIYLWIIHYFKPYSSFDTIKQKQLDKWFNWLLMGVLGFLIFSTLFSSIRKSILGF